MHGFDEVGPQRGAPGDRRRPRPQGQEDLALIEELAQALEAEIACSRPVAEGLNWMGKDRYIGSSGARIAPQLYLAVGISGQLQHMVGVTGAETIVAINSDPNAAIFTAGRLRPGRRPLPARAGDHRRAEMTVPDDRTS